MQKPISTHSTAYRLFGVKKNLVYKAKMLGYVQSGRGCLECRNEVLGRLKLLGG